VQGQARWYLRCSESFDDNVEVALYGESRGGECGFKDFREKMLQNEHSEDDVVEFWDNVCSLKSFLRLTTKMPIYRGCQTLADWLKRKAICQSLA